MTDSCVSRVEISIAARGLRDADLITKSDPFAILYTRHPDLPSAHPSHAPAPAPAPSRGRSATNRDTLARGWTEVGRTETVDNTLSPQFARSFELGYFFERAQEVRVELYDRDARSDANLARHDYLGAAETRLADLVASPGQNLALPLHDDRRGSVATSAAGAASAPARSRARGEVLLYVEEVAGLKRAVTLGLAAKLRGGLLDRRLMVRVLRAREAGDWVVVYASAPVRRGGGGGTPGGGTPFPRFSLSTQKLNNGDPGRPLRVEVYAYVASGAHRLRGEVETSETQLLAKTSPKSGTPLPKELPLQLKLKGRFVGELAVTHALSQAQPTFLDYVFGGCEISVVAAIDFTASNGDPLKVGTLHYNDPHGPNEYEAALRAVTSILAPYDSDQQIHAYGYGARLPPHNTVSHCFALNGNPNSPWCAGTEGVLTAYRKALNHVSLSGPTVFSQILQLASSMADKHVTQESQAYTILLVLTDGIISDMAATVAEIVRASDLPLSIVIVGVGSADFSAMEQLDADDHPLEANGQRMMRDIVQFVPFRKYKGAPALLAEEVLAEIPRQMLSFMESHKIRPNPPRSAVPASSNAYGPDVVQRLSELRRTPDVAADAAAVHETAPVRYPSLAGGPAAPPTATPVSGPASTPATVPLPPPISPTAFVESPAPATVPLTAPNTTGAAPAFDAQAHRPTPPSSGNPYASFLAQAPQIVLPNEGGGGGGVGTPTATTSGAAVEEEAGAGPPPRRKTSEYIPNAYPDLPVVGVPAQRYPRFPPHLPHGV